MCAAAKAPSKYPLLGAMILLIIAIFFHVTSGYYTFLRVAVFLAALYVAFFSHVTGKKTWMWVTILVALVFNPIYPARLPRETWTAVDAFTIAIFLASFSILKIKIK